MAGGQLCRRHSRGPTPCSNAGSVAVASYDAVGCRAPADGALAGSRLQALAAQRTRPWQAGRKKGVLRAPAEVLRAPAVGHGRGREAARSCCATAGRYRTRGSGHAAAEDCLRGSGALATWGRCEQPEGTRSQWVRVGEEGP
jgi:hypothetical protein